MPASAAYATTWPTTPPSTGTAATGSAARSVGFRRLANYIFGANQRDDTISMTAPVAQARGTDGQWTIRFFMPSRWTMDTLPVPDSDEARMAMP